MVITRYVKNGQSSTSQEVVGGVEEHDLLQEKLESQSGGGQNDYQQDCEETTEGDRIKTSSALRFINFTLTVSFCSATRHEMENEGRMAPFETKRVNKPTFFSRVVGRRSSEANRKRSGCLCVER